MAKPLTPNEKKILEFVRDFIQRKGYAPSFQEIKTKFDFASFFSVQRYLQQLQDKGYVRIPIGSNKKRALELVEELSSEIAIPFLGRVAAGRPIEAIELPETIEVPQHMLGRRAATFALRVQGNSMIEDGIHDGDILIIQKQSTAHNGQTVVALVNNEATVKRFFHHGSQVELRPANAQMKPLFVDAHDVSISGVLVGLMRNFK